MVGPKLAGHAYNDARSGARMNDLAGQLNAAGSQRADDVTILMGANDVCTSSISTMTPTRFSTAEVSTVEYLHPGVTGQKNLAAVTWAAGYFAAVG